MRKSLIGAGFRCWFRLPFRLRPQAAAGQGANPISSTFEARGHIDWFHNLHYAIFICSRGGFKFEVLTSLLPAQFCPYNRHGVDVLDHSVLDS